MGENPAVAQSGMACDLFAPPDAFMKTHLRFHHLTVEICADEICRFLQGRPHSSLTQIMEHLCDGCSKLAGTQRLKLWSEVRSVLHRMEERGLVQCVGGLTGNMWVLAEGNVQKRADQSLRN